VVDLKDTACGGGRDGEIIVVGPAIFRSPEYRTLYTSILAVLSEVKSPDFDPVTRGPAIRATFPELVLSLKHCLASCPPVPALVLERLKELDQAIPPLCHAGRDFAQRELPRRSRVLVERHSNINVEKGIAPFLRKLIRLNTILENGNVTFPFKAVIDQLQRSSHKALTNSGRTFFEDGSWLIEVQKTVDRSRLPAPYRAYISTAAREAMRKCCCDALSRSCTTIKKIVGASMRPAKRPPYYAGLAAEFNGSLYQHVKDAFRFGEKNPVISSRFREYVGNMHRICEGDLRQQLYYLARLLTIGVKCGVITLGREVGGKAAGGSCRSVYRNSIEVE
jgi:hypothetical protein